MDLSFIQTHQSTTVRLNSKPVYFIYPHTRNVAFTDNQNHRHYQVTSADGSVVAQDIIGYNSALDFCRQHAKMLQIKSLGFTPNHRLMALDKL